MFENLQGHQNKSGIPVKMTEWKMYGYGDGN